MVIPGKALHNETQRHVRRLATRDSAHIGALDLLIRGLHNAGLWDKISTLCVVAPTAADSLLDLKNNTDSVLYGSPAFVANQGFTTVANTDVINTQVILDASYSSDLMMSVYARNSPAASGHIMGEQYSSGNIILRSATATFLYASLQSTIYTGATFTSGSGGFIAATRTDSSTAVLCMDEETIAKTHASAAWGTNHSKIFVGCSASSDVPTAVSHPNQYSHWSIGKGLTTAELLAYDNLIKAYMTARGAAV